MLGRGIVPGDRVGVLLGNWMEYPEIAAGLAKAGLVMVPLNPAPDHAGDRLHPRPLEHIAAGRGHALLPAHRILLVERGINIVETMKLDELAASGVRDFTLVLNPLPIVGATGAPVRPLALLPEVIGP